MVNSNFKNKAWMILMTTFPPHTAGCVMDCIDAYLLMSVIFASTPMLCAYP